MASFLQRRQTDKHPLYQMARCVPVKTGAQRTRTHSGSLHSGEDWPDSGCPLPSPVLCCLWEVASPRRGGPGIWVGSSAFSQQLPPHPTQQHSWKGAVWRAGSRVCQRREDRVGGCRISIPHFWEPLWLATSKHPDPEAPSPSCSHGPLQWPPGSAGLLFCRWTARIGYRDCHSSDLPGDTG